MHEDVFWLRSRREMLHYACNVLQHADKSVTTDSLYRVIRSAPKSASQLRSSEWQQDSFLHACMAEADKRKEAGELGGQTDSFVRSAQFWFRDYPHLPVLVQSNRTGRWSNV